MSPVKTYARARSVQGRATPAAVASRARSGRRWPFGRLIAWSLVAAGLVGLSIVVSRPVEGPQPAGVRIVASAPVHRAGYSRGCSPGQGCVFGPAWSADNTTEWGHRGCDTRNLALQRDLTDPQIKPGTRGCVVLSGRLQDPYSGQTVQFDRAQAQLVPVDHIWPLVAVWDRGAADWPIEQRRNIANDPLNLQVTTATSNRAKSDKMPDRWLPTTIEGACRYASRFVQVAIKYDLPVTVAEHAAIQRAQAACRR